MKNYTLIETVLAVYVQEERSRDLTYVGTVERDQNQGTWTWHHHWGASGAGFPTAQHAAHALVKFVEDEYRDNGL